ncbi:MAG: FMN-binding glutamate synthase family protein [Candidatus Margulisbacteria bacterium]|nr:FMN-binding glutamate synthase family protein [Candidatus Margulisiibacteriota bacterium]MBU1616505.1 FMN-binding glutamate synthase family protein [Candidatus Margulisiibacteriota bacterium]
MGNLMRPNGSTATDSKNRIQEVAPCSGLCSVCLDGCAGNCEVFRSSMRGREVIYPQPYGKTTSGSTKDYPVDYSHLNIMGTAVGAVGVAPDPDVAKFPNVNVESEVGAPGKPKIKMKVPVFTGALGSTDIARVNWEGFAIGAAISGIMIVVGENVCGMDPKAEIKNGRIINSPELERRVKLYQEWKGDYGNILVQYNVEDGRLGVPEYAIEKLGAEVIEMKWGQGAKDIGGEVKLPTIERALQLKSRGYIVAPDPENKAIEEAYEEGAIKEFERHSRLGMVSEEGFAGEVSRLRKAGAKYVTLKTGAYRPADLARAIKFSSDHQIDLLTIDGASGGTGMSPWRMMCEWGIPTIYLQSMAYDMCEKLRAKGKFVPDLAIAGGFSLEDHIFKAIAMGAPYVKAVCMGRATMIPGMVGKNIEQWIKEGKLPNTVSKYGKSAEEIFVKYEELKGIYGKDFKKIPLGAVAMYSYVDRLATGLRQFMAGERKFALSYLTRDDLVSLTQECTQVTGIPYVMDLDKEICDRILA